MNFFGKVYIFIVLFSRLCIHTQAHILIDIEPEELQRIGEILVESYLEQNLTLESLTTTAIAISRFKKLSFSFVQMFGIMMTLVGANLLTTQLDRILNTPIPVSAVENILKNSTDIHKQTENCENDFGCNKNLCWRTCKTNSTLSQHQQNEQQAWCYTTSNSKLNKTHQCIHPQECSPCWECISKCYVNST